MEKIKCIGARQSEVISAPIIPGCLILTDEHRLYWDNPAGVRAEVTDIIELPNELTRESWPNPMEKFYYVIASHQLYHYHDNEGWVCLNGEPEFIGPDGKILIEYLPGYNGIPGSPGQPGYPGIPGAPGDVVILGPGGTVPEGYLPLATQTVKGIATLGSEGGSARFGSKEDIGLEKVTNDTQVKATDVEDVGPDDRSGRLNVTSSSRLFEIMGGTMDRLATIDKSLIGAINELFHGGGQATIPAGVSGQLVTYSGEKGKFGEPRASDDFIGSPDAQLINSQLLVAPAIRGGVPGLKAISELASKSELETLREIVTEIKITTETGFIKLTEKGVGNGVATLDEKGKLTFSQLPEIIPSNYIIFNDGRTFQELLDSGALKGENGKPGIQGGQGIQGPAGMPGSAGAKGDKGDTGTKGDKGDTGPAGRNGAKGDKGDTGASGPTGVGGPSGPIGPAGPQGIPTTVNGLTGANITITASHITSGTLPTAQLPIVPVDNGGTGQTTLAMARYVMGLGNTTGALPIANGGTGATTASSALTNLGAMPAAFYAGSSSPADRRLLWVDTSNGSILKYWNGSSWLAIKTAWS